MKRNQQESFLLGLVVGTIVAFCGVILISITPLFATAQQETASPAAASGPATGLSDQVTAAPGPGAGRPPEGRGPGAQGRGTASPLAFGTAPEPVVDAFETGGCVACHSIKGVGGGEALVGPPLFRTGVIAAERRPGPSPEAYIEESIRDPNAFIMPNCPTGPCAEGVMPQTYSETLTGEQLTVIVEYLAVLGTPAEADVLSPP